MSPYCSPKEILRHGALDMIHREQAMAHNAYNTAMTEAPAKGRRSGTDLENLRRSISEMGGVAEKMTAETSTTSGATS